MKIAIKCLCGKERIINDWQKKRAKFCSRQCLYKYRVRPRGLFYILRKENPSWFKKDFRNNIKGEFRKGFLPWNKGETKGYINCFGYKVLCINNKEILEHRKVMEDYLGRKLENSEIIHHIDGNKLNNEIRNLEILNRSEHTRLHNRLRLCV